MDLDKLLKPNLSAETAVNLVRNMYGLDVTNIKSMGSFNDQNFYIKVSNEHTNPFVKEIREDGYTLKIINATKSSISGHFESIHASLEHLHKKGLRVPVPIRNVEGNTWKLENVPVTSRDQVQNTKEKCGIHLLTYISGTPIAAIQTTSNIFFQWGRLLAQFHNATEDLISPSLKEKDIFYTLRHVLDVKIYMDIRDDRIHLLHNIMDRYPSEISENIDKLPKGFIHGDFSDQNILSREMPSEGNPNSIIVDGILDFEDMHYGPYLWDIALLMAHASRDVDGMDSLYAIGHVLAGYTSLRRFNELELSLLKMCIECRLCQSLILCLYGKTTDPNNAYIANISSAEIKWSRLQQLASISNEDLLEKWKMIIHSYSLKQ